jgi:hypothetical protein
VLLLDRRVVTKRYGALILEGLPPASRVVGDWADVRAACEEFFARHGIGVEPKAVGDAPERQGASPTLGTPGAVGGGRG